MKHSYLILLLICLLSIPLSSLSAKTDEAVKICTDCHKKIDKKLKGKYHSSPVYANGHIYISSTRGNTLVLKAGPGLEIVSENTLEGEIWATPAVTGEAIIMRTGKFLYKIALTTNQGTESLHRQKGSPVRPADGSGALSL